LVVFISLTSFHLQSVVDDRVESAFLMGFAMGGGGDSILSKLRRRKRVDASRKHTAQALAKNLSVFQLIPIGKSRFRV
jgi:hypothetical protein